MQKYPLCQVYKYPALSSRSLFLFPFFFFFCLPFFPFSFEEHVSHSASQWFPSRKAGCCSWGLCRGTLAKGHPTAPFPNPLQPISLGNQTEGRREKDAGRAGLAPQLCPTGRTPGCSYYQDAQLHWDAQPALKVRAEGWLHERDLQLPRSCAHTASSL